jgi:hypothetical protein
VLYEVLRRHLEQRRIKQFMCQLLFRLTGRFLHRARDIAAVAASRTDSSMDVRRVVIAVTCLAVAVAGTAFFALGLDAADKLASTIGAIVAIVALGATGWIWLTDRSSARRDVRPASKYTVLISKSEDIVIGDGR